MRGVWLVLLALAQACATVEFRGSRAGARADVPTLAQIFSGAELLDKRPELLAIAPDGSSVVVRWSPGIATYAQEEGVLRLIETSGRRAGERCGVELAELLPEPPRPETAPQSAPASQPSRGEREPSAWTYDVRGAALFVARGSGLWRIDARTRQRFELLPEIWRSAAEAASAAGGAQGEIQHLSWSETLSEDASTRDLLVRDDDDLFLLDADTARSTSNVTSADLRWIDAHIGARPADVQWSHDLEIAFCAGGLHEHEAESEPLEPPRFEIWRGDTGAFVALAEFEKLADREDTRLAPDGSWLFALTRDKSRQKPPTPIPNYLTPRVTTTEGRRESADDGPSAVRMYAWDTRTGARSELSPSAPYETGWYAVIGWEPRGNALLLRWTAPDWTCQQHFSITPTSWSQVWPDSDCAEGWVGGPANRARRGASGAYRFATERGGRSQIGGFATVEGEVSDFDVLDDEHVLAEASPRDPGRRELLWLDRAAARRIAQPTGFNHAARASLDRATVAFVHEASGVPAEIWVSDERGARALTSTAPEAYARFAWRRPARRSFTSADGTTVWANVWLPDRRNAPCIVFVHGAGYLQNVTDSLTEYPLNWMFHARLAQLGYAVVDVDYRGSKGYGRAFRTDVKDRLGEKELADIHATLDALASERALDPQRVALYGGSYGGFLTLMALFTEPGRWRAGAALRSVTDWRSYHPTYTQPRLGKPSSNPDAYARSSPIDHVAGLRDPLLLLHGLRDDNVFAQDTLRVVEQLVLQGKQFELMLYPSQGHTYDSGPHWLDQYQRIEAFLRRHLDARVEGVAASR